MFRHDPRDRRKRIEIDSNENRWRSFTHRRGLRTSLQTRRLQGLRDEKLEVPDELPEPEELITEAMEEPQLPLDDLAETQGLFEGNGVASWVRSPVPLGAMLTDI